MTQYDDLKWSEHFKVGRHFVFQLIENLMHSNDEKRTHIIGAQCQLEFKLHVHYINLHMG
jgi:hypothetical protein